MNTSRPNVNVNVPLPELLSPAGSPDSLRAALAAGADAVYFGGTSFSNRMRAKNFGDDELSEAIRLCHSVGAAAHITVNTRVRDRELDSVLRFADVLLNNDDTAPDALIVADLGIAAELHERFPQVALHASTQTSLSSLSDCLMLQRLGFSRLVIPRELSRDEIRALCAASPIEIEMFIHGAHCVSCSGQCLMSAMLGGRSGNRGECAQPCRLPFTSKRCDGVTQKSPKKGTRPNTDVLSLADMCLAGHIPEVIDSGVRSLKLEGRLKAPAYVYGTTRIYRRLLDERRAATRDEVAELAALFSRGFTDGYFTGHYSKMSSIRISGDADSSDRSGSTSATNAEIRRALDERVRTHAAKSATALSAVFRLTHGESSSLTLSLRGRAETSVTVYGAAPEEATGAPLTCASAARSLTKLGGTGYVLSEEDIDFTLEEGLWYPISALNDLRRRALSSLTETLEAKTKAKAERTTEGKGVTVRGYRPPTVSGREAHVRAERTAELADVSLLRGLRDEGRLSEFTEQFDTIYVPAHSYAEARSIAEKVGDTAEYAAVLPVFTPSDEVTDTLLERVRERGCRRVLCHTLGQIGLTRRHELTADVSFRANITNSAARAEYARLGAERIYLSPELPQGAYSELYGGAIVYGRLPVMTLARCVICDGRCPLGRAGGRAVGTDCKGKVADGAVGTNGAVCRGVLRDRRGAEFPVLGYSGYDCVNVVYNTVPTWMADRPEALRGIPLLHYMFTLESPPEALSAEPSGGYRRSAEPTGGYRRL